MEQDRMEDTSVHQPTKRGRRETESLDDRFIQLEAQIVEQDHRPLHVVNTFLASRQWPRDDPRRPAALRALIWRVLFSPATLATTGGLVAILTIFVLIWQNMLIREQNEYFRNQLAQQHHQIIAQQSVDNQTLRTQAIEQIYGPAFGDNPRVKAEAVRTLVAIERARTMDASDDHSSAAESLSFDEADLTGTSLVNADLRRVTFRHSILSKANLNRANLEGASLRFVTGDGLAAMGAKLDNVHIAFSDLTGAELAGASFIGAIVANSRLENADLSGSDWSGSSWVNLDLRSASLVGIRNWNQVRTMRGTNIFGVTGVSDDFFEHAKSLGAISQEHASYDFEARRDAQLMLEEGRGRAGIY